MPLPATWPPGLPRSHRSNACCIRLLTAAPVTRIGLATSAGRLGCSEWCFTPVTQARSRPLSTRFTILASASAGGGYESLVLPVDPVRSAGTWNEDGQLVRFNIGLEDVQSLKDDLAAALPLLNSKS